MTDRILSITIRPPIEEFSALAIPIAIFIQYIDDSKYIVSLERGQKEGQFNHYQIALITAKHIDTIRRVVNRLFKPYLSPSTLKKGIWKKVINHNNKVSLLGYCQKEGNIYSTNIDSATLEAELNKYLEQTKDKRPYECVSKRHDGRLRKFSICDWCCVTCLPQRTKKSFSF